MATPGARKPFTFVGELVQRIPEGPRYAKVAAASLVVVVVVLIAIGIARGRRSATWAPIDVVESRDPLQDLPVRVAGSDGVVAPAHTYDAVIDMGSISSLVVGVDLDYVPKGAARYEVVVIGEKNAVRFRDAIATHYFDEGRFMLRLFARKFPPGDYLMEIVAFDSEGNDRVVGVSWFQTTR